MSEQKAALDWILRAMYIVALVAREYCINDDGDFLLYLDLKEIEVAQTLLQDLKDCYVEGACEV
jgi:hypothetical protein